MSVKKFVPALIFAAAFLSTAWWLLREAPEQERFSPSMPAQGAALPARAAESRADAAARDDEPPRRVPASASSLSR